MHPDRQHKIAVCLAAASIALLLLPFVLLGFLFSQDLSTRDSTFIFIICGAILILFWCSSRLIIFMSEKARSLRVRPSFIISVSCAAANFWDVLLACAVVVGMVGTLANHL